MIPGRLRGPKSSHSDQHLRQIQPSTAISVPRPEVRAAMRAWRAGTATAEQQKRAYSYVVYELAGIRQLTYAMPGEESVVNWRQGCRYVGLAIEAATELVIEEPTPPEPPARTMTERVRRQQNPQPKG